MSGFQPIRSIHILVVEDDQMVATMLAEAFATESAKMGLVVCFLVSITASGEVARDWVRQSRFDGYILDGNLSGRLHGTAVAEQIREYDETCPIVLHCSGAKNMRATAILHDLQNIEKTQGSTDTAARYIITKLFATTT